MFEWTISGDRYRFNDGKIEEFIPSEGGEPDSWEHPVGISLAASAFAGFIAAVAELDTYRSALEPLALAWSQSTPRNWLEVGLTGEQQLALGKVCRLLGIEDSPASEE